MKAVAIEMTEDRARDAEQRIVSARQEPGLVLVSLRAPGRVLKLNETASQILRRAQRKQILASVREWLAAGESSATAVRPPLAWTFRSGRRTYVLRGLWLEGPVSGRRVLALLLERINPSRLGIERCRRHYHLSSREVDVVTALSQGHTDKAIAEELGVGLETVRGHLKSIRIKLGVSTRTAILRTILGMVNAD
jgi:DNA-binding NarL/FixJ family response regulator